MRNFKILDVSPSIPENIKFLGELVNNVWWCWHNEAIDLFRRMDYRLWSDSIGNPRVLLRSMSQEALEGFSKDKSFVNCLNQLERQYRLDVDGGYVDLKDRAISYFSLEYGIHESLAIYSGGLGILAGDHLKSASDSKLPLVAVGLLYKQGYFRQTIDSSGWQHEIYEQHSINDMPLRRACTPAGEPIELNLRLLNDNVKVIVWQMDVGNVPLLLLDTEVPENREEFRSITWQLYGGDRKMRLHQELLLGIGGYNALVAAGCKPAVCHINEGHAAFLTMARLSHIMRTEKVDIETALEMVWRTNVFTTHTPVPAGNEVFDVGLLTPYLKALEEELGIPADRILKWGMPHGQETHELSMTVLGLRLSHYNNGVSKLHGEVARSMWSYLWPEIPTEEVPITHVTNGVHVPSWMCADKRSVYDKYLPLDWTQRPHPDIVDYVDRIPAVELWLAHQRSKARLVRHARSRLMAELRVARTTYFKVDQIQNTLDPNILTIGFARRFATYKRASFLLNNKERLLKLLTSELFPVQFVFAGKSHPADEQGKRLIRELIDFARHNNVTHRLVMLPNYDIQLGRLMIQGVDVWLNNPIRPQEASGTSGMKATVNGVPNFSILDGWWAEGYTPGCGWKIESREDIADFDARNAAEATSFYDVLENEIIPRFYDLKGSTMPEEWGATMKEAIKIGIYQFSSCRMVSEYNERFYQPAVQKYNEFAANDFARAKESVQRKFFYQKSLPSVWIRQPKIANESALCVGDHVEVTTEVYLDGMQPQDVCVEIYSGIVEHDGNISNGRSLEMELNEDLGEHKYSYRAVVKCRHAGRFGVTARVVPAGVEWKNCMPGMIVWAHD